jgi:hypothetical protein
MGSSWSRRPLARPILIDVNRAFQMRPGALKDHEEVRV